MSEATLYMYKGADEYLKLVQLIHFHFVHVRQVPPWPSG